MKLINKYNSLDDYYSAQKPHIESQIEKHIFVPYNSTPTSEIEVFSHPTQNGHTFVGFTSMNQVSKNDPVLEHQYSMTHLDENHHLVNYQSVLLSECSASEISDVKMDLFDNLNYQHLDILEKPELETVVSTPARPRP